MWTLDQKNEIVTVDTIPPSTVCCVGEAPGAAVRMLFKQDGDVRANRSGRMIKKDHTISHDDLWKVVKGFLEPLLFPA